MFNFWSIFKNSNWLQNKKSTREKLIYREKNNSRKIDFQKKMLAKKSSGNETNIYQIFWSIAFHCDFYTNFFPLKEKIKFFFSHRDLFICNFHYEILGIEPWYNIKKVFFIDIFQKILLEKKKSDQCRYVLNRMKRWRFHLQDKIKKKSQYQMNIAWCITIRLKIGWTSVFVLWNFHAYLRNGNSYSYEILKP